jgi:hypothetical protein
MWCGNMRNEQLILSTFILLATFQSCGFNLGFQSCGFNPNDSIPDNQTGETSREPWRNNDGAGKL